MKLNSIIILNKIKNLLLFIAIPSIFSCGSGGGADTQNTIVNNVPISYSYSPPSGKSIDNCVAKSDSANWQEDFLNSELDISKWSFDEGCNNNGGGCNGNNEYQNYTLNDSDNLFIENGFLKIQPIYEINTGSDNVTQNYTSAKIMTKDKFPIDINSRVTICFKLPEGTGLWPAVWMLPFDNSPWPSGGEIDLIEAKGRSYPIDGSPGQSNIISSAVHFGTQWPDHKYIVNEFYSSIENNYQDFFHSVTLIFQNNKIDIYVNDETTPHLSVDPSIYPLNQYTYPFNRQYYLIINVAVGGNFDSGRVEPSEICIDSSCSNFIDNPDKKRLIIDWIEYEKLY